MKSPSTPVTVEHDLAVPMRDGVVLRADVFRPGGGGIHPTLLHRSPYDKSQPQISATFNPVGVARRGFLVVVQDTRGRFASAGEWEPLCHEREDGYDTVEWAARLPGSSGRVGMYGGSYCGSTQWMAALEQPPSLAAIAPMMTWSEPLDGLLARGGALELGLALPWALSVGAANLPRNGDLLAELRHRLEALLDEYDALPERGYWQLPVEDSRLLATHDVPDLGMSAMRLEPALAARSRVVGHHDRVAVPSLHIGGWYDLFLQGTLDNFTAMAELDRPARLVVGPWRHGDTRLLNPPGELDLGIRANGLGVPVHEEGDLDDLQLAWFRRALGAAGAEPEPERAPVRIFVMGRNAWRDEQGWPLTRARQERWFLAADGGLMPRPPETGAEPTEFEHDPSDPVPTVGGQTMLHVGLPPGVFDQRRIESHPNLLTFTSEPLQRDLEVTGRLRVVLHAQSSAPSADWVARLCDVHPDGRSFNLCDGIKRIPNGAEAPAAVEIDLWSTSNVFLAGHRLRVHVCGSNFPRWDRNLGTGEPDAEAARPARQWIFHDSERASFIELPVIT